MTTAAVLQAEEVTDSGVVDAATDKVSLSKSEVHRTDARSILSQIKHNEKQIQLKRRWLLGIAASKSDLKHFKKSQFLKDRFLPESLLREDDIFYESVRTYVEGAFGACHIESKCNVLQFDMLLADIPKIKRQISSCLDNMTTKGLYLLAVIITGGSIKFEKTRCKMKKIIKNFLSSALSSQIHNRHQLEIFKQLLELLTDPQHFRDNCTPISASRSKHAAVKEVLDDLDEFPQQTLIAMCRKLKRVKATMPQLLPRRQGWGRKHLIRTVKKISENMLSQLGEQDELQEPLAKAMAVADLSRKLATTCNNIVSKEFYQFSPEIKALQNDIMKAIRLVKTVGIPVLRNLELLLEQKANLSTRLLRPAFRKFFTELLFECNDMDRIPENLVEIIDVINQSSGDRPLGLLEEKIEEEVDCILNVSAQVKQIVLDLLPDHGFDEDFTDAYGDQLEESDEDDYDDCQIERDRHFMDGNCDSMDSNYKAESIGQSVPFDFNQPTSMADEKNCISSTVSPERVSGENFVGRQDLHESNAGMDHGNGKTNFSCEAVEPEPTKDNISKNQYLAIQDVCDETSTLTHKLIGHVLWEFAKFEGLDLSRSQSLYLRGDNQVKDVKAAEQSSSSENDARNSAIVRIVEEMVPSFSDSALERLKMLVGL